MEEEEEDILFDQADVGDDRTSLLSTPSINHVQTSEHHRVSPKSPTRCFRVFTTICLCAAFLGLVSKYYSLIKFTSIVYNVLSLWDTHLEYWHW